MTPTTSATRPKTTYDTNLTDDQWATIEPLLQEAKPWGGRPIRVDLREVVNALIFMNRTGCQWRLIPSDFPRPGAIRYYFDKWTDNGTWIRINDVLRQRAREALERDPEPSIGVMDSQSAKTTEAGGDRGFDAGKKNQRTETSDTRRYEWVSAADVGACR